MKKVLLIIALALSFSANAATIQTTSTRVSEEFIDLSLSHLEVDTGLEWLNFSSLINGEEVDMTLGHSINSALDAYTSPEQGGWRMATYTEVYNLFDMFFPTFVSGTDGRMQIDDSGTSGDINEERNSWLLSFGTYIADDGSLQSRGWYLDENNNAQVMGATLLTNPLDSYLYGQDYDLMGYTADTFAPNVGVFMVRDFAVVPIPAAVWLFGSGLLGLVAVARRRS